MAPPVDEAFLRHRAQVESVARGILRDPDEARDVAADTFLALLERGPDDADLVLPWLLRTARNRALNRARDRSRAARRLLAIRPEDDAPEPVDDERLRWLLRRTLEGMSERDRLVLRLRFEDEWSHEAIAAEIGTTPTQARVVLHRAVKRLRDRAVDILAEHHDVPKTCRSALARASHATEHCARCLPLTDEIRAFGAHALPAVPVGLLERLIARLPAVRTPDTSALGARMAEVIAALGLTVSTLAPGLAPASATAAAPAERPVRISAADTEQRAHPQIAAIPSAPLSRGDVAGRARIDDDHDEPATVGRTWRTLGIPLRLPAMFSDELPAGTDIRALELETRARADGTSLIVRFVMGGPIEPSTIFRLTMTAPEPDCAVTIEARAHSASAPTISTACFRRVAGTVGYGPNDIDEVAASVDVNVFTIEIAFDALHGANARALHRGARLESIIAWSMSDMASDRAPEHDAASYAIPR